jgi:hypothetical protein
MKKEQLLQIIKLLSALESWGFSNKQMFPDYLHDDLCRAVKMLETELLCNQEQGKPDYWLGYGLQAHTEKPFDDATPLYTKNQP